MAEGRAAIAGSAPVHSSSISRLEDLSAGTTVSASIILQRQAQQSAIEEQLFSPDFQPLSRDAAARQLGADPEALSAVEGFCQQNGLQIIGADAATRTLKVEGSAAQIEAAFGIRLGWYQSENGQKFISYQGEITVPQDLASSIMAVTGLDNRPIARAHEA